MSRVVSARLQAAYKHDHIESLSLSQILGYILFEFESSQLLSHYASAKRQVLALGMPPPPVTSPTRSANCGLCISESALGSLSVLLLRYIIQLKRGGLSLILFAVSTAPWASIYDIHRQLYFNPFPLLPATTFTGLLPDINSCLVLGFYSPAKPLAGGKEGS